MGAFILGWGLIVIIGAGTIYWFATFAQREAHRRAGEARCNYCRARLKRAPGGNFADYCKRCGRPQPWAKRG
jgi:hypothetical protein